MTPQVLTMPETPVYAAIARPEVKARSGFPPGQWVLLLAGLGLAGAARLAPGAAWQAVCAALFFLISTAALVRSFRTAVATRVLGPALLTAGCWLFFALEAMAGALEEPAFRVPRDLRIGDTQFSVPVVGTALLCVAIFQLALVAGYSVRLSPSLPVRALAARFDTVYGRWTSTHAALALLVLVPLYIAFGLDAARALHVIQQARAGSLEEMFPGLEANLYWVSLFGSTVLVVEGLVFARGAGRWRAAAGAVLSAPLWMTGARHLVLYILMPVILGWLLTLRGRHSYRKVLRIAAVLVLVALALQGILLVRAQGWDRMADVDFNKVLTSKPTFQFEALMFAVHLVPEHHPYFMEPMTPYFLYHWIPRRLWTDKPIPAAWAYYNGTWVENRKTNVTPSIIGQFYVNWGVAGVVFAGLWLGWLTAICDRAVARLDTDRQRLALVTAGMFYAFLFCSFRYYSPYYLQYWLFGTIPMLILTRTRVSRANNTI